MSKTISAAERGRLFFHKRKLRFGGIGYGTNGGHEPTKSRENSNRRSVADDEIDTRANENRVDFVEETPRESIDLNNGGSVFPLAGGEAFKYRKNGSVGV